MQRAKRWWGVLLGLLGIAGAGQVPAAHDAAATQRSDETTLKQLLKERPAGVQVRSRHAALDRLLTAGDPAADSGHDKTVFDKEYDKAYNREIYSKTYEKTYQKS